MNEQKAHLLIVWFIRIACGKREWSTTQAGESAENAIQRYLSGYKEWGVDVSDYRFLSVIPANAETTKAYYKIGNEDSK